MNEIIEKLEKKLILSEDLERLSNLNKDQLCEYKLYIDSRLNSYSKDEIDKVLKLLKSNTDIEFNNELNVEYMKLDRFYDLYKTLILSKKLGNLLLENK